MGPKMASGEGRCLGAWGLARWTLATFGTPPKDRHPPLNQLLSLSLACPTSWANIPEIITESLPIWGFMSLETAWLLEGKGKPMGEIGHSCPLNWAPKISALKWTLKKHPETNGKAREDKGRSVQTWAPKTTAPSLTNFYPSTKPSFYQSLHLSTECFTHLPSFHLFDSASSYRLISDIASACMRAHFSHVQLFAVPWTAAHKAFLGVTMSQSLPKFMSIALLMPSNHLIL